MRASSDGTGSAHSFQELFLVLPRGFTWQFDLYVDCFSIQYTVRENIRFTMLANIYNSTVLRIKLANRVVSCYAAVLA